MNGTTMSSNQYELASAPSGARAVELWLQHAAGFIIFEDARRYALDQLDAGLSTEARVAAEKSVDDAIYGVMMILDGVTGSLSNARESVELQVVVKLVDRDPNASVPVKAQVDLADGDGMCLGYHGWLEGDFGGDLVVSQSQDGADSEAEE